MRRVNNLASFLKKKKNRRNYIIYEVVMVLKEIMRVVVQEMDIMDVLCDAVYNILTLKILNY